MKAPQSKPMFHIVTLLCFLAAIIGFSSSGSVQADHAFPLGSQNIPSNPFQRPLLGNGYIWNPVGSGANNVVAVITVDGTNVYAGGSFTDIGGDPNADRIAKWNGTTWSALGSGLNSTVRAIVVSGTDLYVGGQFTDAGGDPNADYIAKWNGTSWSALGTTPLTSDVNTIAVSGTDIYVGGDFIDAGGNTSADKIAKWNGTSWSALGSGLNTLVRDIAVSGTDVYAGGDFTNVGGDPNADMIAKWNGSAWSAVGSTPLNGNVQAITVDGTDIYVGGQFTNVGGNADADYFVQWDGTNWLDFGPIPLNNEVRAIFVNNDYMYVAGFFTDAGGYASGDYATQAYYNGTNWVWGNFNGPLNGPAVAIALLNGEIYVGGAFTDAGGAANADYITKFGPDVDDPVVTSFTATSPTASINIPIPSFTATDNAGIDAYLITESSTAPLANNPNWTLTVPSTYTVPGGGTYTLYPWVKDYTGNVSAVYGSPVTVTVTANTATPSKTPTITRTPTIGASPTQTQQITPTRTPTATVQVTTLTLTSNGAHDGWVRESGENTTIGADAHSAASTFKLGDSNARLQARGILSFGTGQVIPDTAVITAVSLKVKQQSITGPGNPVTIFQGFMADIKTGTIGAIGLEISDFQTATSGTYGPFSPTAVNGWYTINLTSGKASINKLVTNNGLTQIRLRFQLDDNNDAVANYLNLFTGNAAAANRPQLVIKYYVP